MSSIDPKVLIEQDIFEILGVTDAPQEEKDELLNGMLQTILNRAFFRIIANIPEDKQGELEGLFSGADNEKVDAFLKQYELPGLKEFLAQEMLLYKAELIKEIKGE